MAWSRPELSLAVTGMETNRLFPPQMPSERSAPLVLPSFLASSWALSLMRTVSRTPCWRRMRRPVTLWLAATLAITGTDHWQGSSRPVAGACTQMRYTPAPSPVKEKLPDLSVVERRFRDFGSAAPDKGAKLAITSALSTALSLGSSTTP